MVLFMERFSSNVSLILTLGKFSCLAAAIIHQSVYLIRIIAVFPINQ